MTIRTAKIILGMLRGERPLRQASRVASRWLRAFLNREYDIMLRLQMLEGARGVPVGSWFDKGKRGLDEAAASYAGTAIVPDWLTPGDTGMSTLVDRTIEQVLRSYRVDLEAPDVINSVLYGIPLGDVAGGAQKLRAPYEAGATLSGGIVSGSESPKRAAAGRLIPFIKKQIGTYAKSHRSESVPIDEEGRPHDVEDVSHPSYEAPDLLTDILFRNFGDPLGKRIREFMRMTWQGTNQEKAMNWWLDWVEKHHEFPDKQDVSEAVGIKNPRNFSQNYWNRSWRRFFEALWGNRDLLDALKDRYEQEGVVWFQQKPRLDSLIPVHKHGFDIRPGTAY